MEKNRLTLLPPWFIFLLAKKWNMGIFCRTILYPLTHSPTQSRAALWMFDDCKNKYIYLAPGCDREMFDLIPPPPTSLKIYVLLWSSLNQRKTVWFVAQGLDRVSLKSWNAPNLDPATSSNNSNSNLHSTRSIKLEFNTLNLKKELSKTKWSKKIRMVNPFPSQYAMP